MITDTISKTELRAEIARLSATVPVTVVRGRKAPKLRTAGGRERKLRTAA